MSNLCEGAKQMLDSHSDYDSSKLVFNDMDLDGVYSIFDSCACVYGTPFVMDNDNTAIRSFTDYCHIPDTSLFKHPEDYSLVRLGSFNKKTGALETLFQPDILLRASNIVYSVKKSLNLGAEGAEKTPQAQEIKSPDVDVQDVLNDVIVGGDN